MSAPENATAPEVSRGRAQKQKDAGMPDSSTDEASASTLPLEPHHLADLRRSGLTDATIEAAGVYSVDRDEAKTILRFDPGSGGWAIPYPAHGHLPPFIRLKPDTPFRGRDGKPAKYLSPIGARSRLYTPPLILVENLQSKRLPLWVTEGEKKSLAACQAGLVCVGLAGVTAWRARDEYGISHVIPDWDAVWLRNRHVLIAFDSDVEHKPAVAWERYKLAVELRRRGAIVEAVKLPEMVAR